MNFKEILRAAQTSHDVWEDAGARVLPPALVHALVVHELLTEFSNSDFMLKNPCSTPNSVLPLKLQTFSDTLLGRVGEEAAASILELLRGAVSNASREPVGLSEGCLKQD